MFYNSIYINVHMRMRENINNNLSQLIDYKFFYRF